MNFFPNLTIHFHLSAEAPVDQARPPTSRTTSSSSFPSPEQRTPTTGNAIGHLIQRFLRSFESQTPDEGSPGDVHFYVNLETMSGTTNETGGGEATTGLTIEQIHQATTLEAHLHEPQTCVVCHHPIETSSIAQTMTVCGHSFHPVCIERWLVRNNSCPVCRAQV